MENIDLLLDRIGDGNVPIGSRIWVAVVSRGVLGAIGKVQSTEAGNDQSVIASIFVMPTGLRRALDNISELVLFETFVAAVLMLMVKNYGSVVTLGRPRDVNLRRRLGCRHRQYENSKLRDTG